MTLCSGHHPRNLPVVYALVASTMLLISSAASAQPGAEQRVQASDGHDFDNFGVAVDIDRDVVVVGASWHDVPDGPSVIVRAGAVYVFRYNGSSWVEVQKLVADDGEQGDEFGHDVAIKNNLIVVGARFDDDAAGMGASDSGAAYLFEWNGTIWEQIEKLVPDTPNPQIKMGTSVDIEVSIPDEGMLPEQTNVVAGAPFFDGRQGITYLYRRANTSLWERIGELQDDDTSPSNPDQRGEAGSALAMVGDLLVIGAPDNDEPPSNAGTAYGFGRGQIVASWVQSGQYEPAGLGGGERLGDAVAADRLGDTYVAVIGAPGSNSQSNGRVFVYDSVGAPEIFMETSAHRYGSAVAIHGRSIAIGAPGDDTAAQNGGAVYLLARDDLGAWSPSGSIVASDPGIDKEFGASVALEDGTLAVGSPSFNTIPRPGAVYLYTSGIFRDGFESGDTQAW